MMTIGFIFILQILEWLELADFIYFSKDLSSISIEKLFHIIEFRNFCFEKDEIWKFE